MSGVVYEVKVVASVRTLSSRWLAVCCAVVYLVVSAVLGAALLIRPEVPAVAVPGGTPPTYVADQGSRGETTTVVTTPPPPQGYQRVAGPAKVETVIPVGWTIARAGGPGAMRATDPSDSGRFVGYGGAPATSTDIASIHVAQETKFAQRTSEYNRISLNRATYAGHPAIEWEYEHNDGSGTQHVRALFWIVNGVEFFIFASGPQVQWSRMLPLYDEMVASSRP